ncbi:glutaredoxin family protein [Methylomagnum ishizawai]|uniref:glutaredoxin family protein n=1 Tax=Methylomagnum ishizawai TaxID=1760988 RepID=UPI0020CADFF2|nr:glutaredoxin family protein [Methylomagnum ishizawai]
MRLNLHSQTSRPIRLELYGTYGCHLCDEAEALCRAHPGLELRKIDIADDADLMERYGIRIPVLRDPASELELGWPFDAATLQTFLQNLTSE